MLTIKVKWPGRVALSSKLDPHEVEAAVRHESKQVRSLPASVEVWEEDHLCRCVRLVRTYSAEEIAALPVRPPCEWDIKLRLKN